MAVPSILANLPAPALPPNSSLEKRVSAVKCDDTRNAIIAVLADTEYDSVQVVHILADPEVAEHLGGRPPTVATIKRWRRDNLT